MRSWVWFTSTAGWIGSSAVAAAGAGAVLNLRRRAPGKWQQTAFNRAKSFSWSMKESQIAQK
jgi:hypothetical protein